MDRDVEWGIFWGMAMLVKSCLSQGLGMAGIKLLEQTAMSMQGGKKDQGLLV